MLPPFFDASSIVHEDEDLVVVNKPPGMSSQAADPAHPDDVVHRLARFLGERDGSLPSLGVHQRLDRDTSGVMVLARSPRANRSLAKQFEERTVAKTYLACVRGYRGGARTLAHTLGELDRGRVHVLTDGDPRGKEARADVAEVERHGDRSLVAVTLHTGRTHQIRVQLAAIRAPVAGDVLYGDAPAHRLMLHASALVLDHPATGARTTFRAKVPAVFKRWLGGEDAIPLADAKALKSALARAFRSRASLHEARADDRAIDAYRLLHAEADGVAGLAVDVYGEHLVAQLYEDVDADVEAGVLDALDSLGFRGVYLKRRPENASRIVDPTRAEIAPSHALRGVDAPASFVVREHGVPYEVRLGDGLSTGIFLDQRDNRRRVTEGADGARVLNLFAYTCAFSCAAARGGAREVTSVDAAANALAWGESNFERGGYACPHRVVRGDVFEVLEAAARAGERYDVVLCDPPTYSTTKHGRWKSGADWSRLVSAVLSVTAPAGTVYFCSNDRRMSEVAFRRIVHGSLRASGRTGSLTSFHAPSDFPLVVGSDATMKTLRLRTDG